MNYIMILFMFYFHVIDGLYFHRLRCENDLPVHSKDYLRSVLFHAYVWSMTVHLPIMSYLYFKGVLFDAAWVLCFTAIANTFIRGIGIDMRTPRTKYSRIAILQIIVTAYLYLKEF